MPRVIHRTVPKKPPFAVDQILAWADAFHALHRRWPTRDCGRIANSLGETWMAVDVALQKGHRGLPGGSSLAKLLAEQRGHRHYFMTPRLSRKKILAWADAFYQQHGTWPSRDAGPVAEVPGETWLAIDAALHHGTRGLQGRSSLARLLAQYRGKRNPSALPPLSVEQIVAWAEAYRTLFGEWPTRGSGEVGNRGEKWWAIDTALRYGFRGLPGGSSLSRLFKQRMKDREHSE